jgi:hypothetical protein
MSFLGHSIVCIGILYKFNLLTNFSVVVQKDWKGLQESTYISRAFSDQGVRIRLRKEARNPAKSAKRVHDEYKEEEEEELAHDYRDGALSHSVQPTNGYIKNEPEVAGPPQHTPQYKRVKRSYEEHTSGEYDHYNNEQQWRSSASSSYPQPYQNGASLSSSSSVPLAVGMPGASTTAYVSSMAPPMNGAAAAYVPAQYGAQTGYN